MTTSARWMVAAAMAGALAGCGFDEATLGEVEKPIIDCPAWNCGTNSATMGDGLFFHELDLSGWEPNDARMKYVGISIPGVKSPLRLRVDRDRLIVFDEYTGGIYEGWQLVGAVLTLRTDEQEFLVRIASVGEIEFWVAPDRPVPTYTFEFAPTAGGGIPSKDYQRMCGQVPPLDDRDPDWGTIDRTLAIVFQGDRYDARAKTVSDDAREWFNVACAGSAVAKMHLLRHTAAGYAPGYWTTVPERQAMLKMLTDDICGTGTSFTVDGEDVRYMDRGRWHPFNLAAAGTVESIWTEQGAYCLDEPRRYREDWTVRDRIAAECGGVPPPPCDSLKWSWDAYGYGISANPL